MPITGRWRIVDMELWDLDAIDLLGPAFIELRDDDQGSFRFIAVEGWMDTRNVARDGRPGIEFSWEGSDETDPASGRGWATVAPDGALEGRIFFHMGDDSSFRAINEELVTRERHHIDEALHVSTDGIRNGWRNAMLNSGPSRKSLGNPTGGTGAFRSPLPAGHRSAP